MLAEDAGGEVGDGFDPFLGEGLVGFFAAIELDVRFLYMSNYEELG